MLLSRPKRYVDCSVQTEGPEPNVACNQLSCTRATPAIPSFGFDNSPSEKPIAVVENLAGSGTTGCDDAYSHSQTSKTGVDALFVLPSLQERKQPTIGYGRPSALISSSKRMTSLPAIVSTGEILGRLDEQIRIASMPERGKFGTLQLSQHSECVNVDISGTMDIAYCSLDSPQRLAHLESEPARRYPADLPQTPSPPSSPDSVMIIADEGQVSGSFLRRPSIDESGWITWASSPPRPIPALHGPSSLPYARCPSGAEGTLVEGDDLSHKIWGLGIDDAQSSNPRPNKTPISQNLQQHNSRNDHITFQPLSHDGIGCGPQMASSKHERDIIIDLSRPLNFGNRSDPTGISHKYAPNLVQHSRNMQLETPARVDFNRPYPEVYSPHGSRLPVNMGQDQALSNTLGLGLNWNNLVTSETRNPSSASRNNNDTRNRLNSAAPVFVPATTSIGRPRSKMAYMRHAGDAESPIPQPLDKRSMFNMTSQYRDQQGHYLPTPPSTASPRWSPIFSQPNDLEIPTRKAITKHIQNSSIYHAPKVYSPQLDVEEYASRLSAMVEQLAGRGLDLNIQRFSPIHQLSAQQSESPVLQIRSNKVVEHTKPSVSTNESIDRHLMVVDSNQRISDQETVPTNQSMNTNNLLFSSERRRNLSYQHPRSIPLARLIQRRLSSVVEEDVGRDSLLPFLRKKVSDFTFNRFSVESPDLQMPSGALKLEYPPNNEHLEYTMGDEENIESAVSMEDPPMSVGNSEAIVKLPQKIQLCARINSRTGWAKGETQGAMLKKKITMAWSFPLESPWRTENRKIGIEEKLTQSRTNICLNHE